MHLKFFLFALTGCIMTSSVISTTNHVVGDAVGWNLPHNPAFYSDWAKNKVFHVGDTLEFLYTPGLNNVVQVSKDDFDLCSLRSDIKQYDEANSKVTLDKPGDFYFFCSVGKHCEFGQKLHITVS